MLSVEIGTICADYRRKTKPNKSKKLGAERREAANQMKGLITECLRI